MLRTKHTPALEMESVKELLNLDRVVAGGQSPDSLLYINAEFNLPDFNIADGDLLVLNKTRKPILTDLVLQESENGYAFKRYSAIENLSQPLRLVARNGKPVKSRKADLIKIFGVVTHILKTLSEVPDAKI